MAAPTHQQPLSLCASQSVTDAGLKELAALSQLKELNLHGCVGVTDAGAATIVRLASTAVPFDEGSPEPPLIISDFGPLGQHETCPRCGAGSDRLRPYVTVDHLDDRALRLVICGTCGWQDYCDL